jgi:hypothetical protein
MIVLDFDFDLLHGSLVWAGERHPSQLAVEPQRNTLFNPIKSVLTEFRVCARELQLTGWSLHSVFACRAQFRPVRPTRTVEACNVAVAQAEVFYIGGKARRSAQGLSIRALTIAPADTQNILESRVDPKCRQPRPDPHDALQPVRHRHDVEHQSRRQRCVISVGRQRELGIVDSTRRYSFDILD